MYSFKHTNMKSRQVPQLKWKYDGFKCAFTSVLSTCKATNFYSHSHTILSVHHMIKDIISLTATWTFINNSVSEKERSRLKIKRFFCFELKKKGRVASYQTRLMGHTIKNKRNEYTIISSHGLAWNMTQCALKWLKI